MELTVTPYSSLRKSDQSSFVVHLQPASSVADLLTELNIAQHEVEMVAINGLLSQFNSELQDQDRVVLIPFVSGG
ncbi:MAG: MoaD/ThiS family protein [Desulfovermiculus sp.]|nr:MoaD/ThiS family protein [Desulfovermiculus sp.]